jgi:glycosyltransferase involved in cell wall biosynthesis
LDIQKPPRISVVIPVYNAERTLDDCLRTVLASDYAEIEVIVADDGSTDASRSIAAQHPVTLVELGLNQGAAAAKNRGAEAATGEILFFTDSDVLIPPDALTIVAEGLSNPGLTGVVGLLSPDLPYNDFASQFKNLWMHYTYARLPDEVGLFYTSAASIRRSIFEAEGGFDEGYRGASVTEDMDFGQRLMTAGHRIRLDKRLQVRHLKQYRPAELLRTDLVRSRALSKILLRNKLARTGRKHFASVPWFFTASVPISALMALGLLLALLGPVGAGLGLFTASYAAILALNGPFLGFLGRSRGAPFLAQSALFLPLNLFVSGLGIVGAILDIARGDKY